MTKAMPGARLTQNSQQTAQTEEQKAGDDDDHSPLQLRRRMISSQKTFALTEVDDQSCEGLRLPAYPWH
jgi:hypothetical protein